MAKALSSLHKGSGRWVVGGGWGLLRGGERKWRELGEGEVKAS